MTSVTSVPSNSGRAVKVEEDPMWEMWPGRATLQIFGLAKPLAECKGILQPEVYLKAGGELLALLFIVTWGVTIGVHGTEGQPIAENPLKTRLGYNNFCVGLDTVPARFPGQVMFCLAYYAVIRYCSLSMKRSFERRRLGNPQALWTFSVFADIFLMLSITVFALVFVVTPDITVYGHTLPFIGFIYARLFVIIARMMESKRTTNRGYLFLAIYTVVSLFLPVYYMASYIYWDIKNPHNSTGGMARDPDNMTLLPWWGGMACDYTWFVCLPLTGVFLHNDPEDLQAMLAITSQYDRDELVNQDQDLHLGSRGNARAVVRGATMFCILDSSLVGGVAAIVYLATGVCLFSMAMS